MIKQPASSIKIDSLDDFYVLDGKVRPVLKSKYVNQLFDVINQFIQSAEVDEGDGLELFLPDVEKALFDKNSNMSASTVKNYLPRALSKLVDSKLVVKKTDRHSLPLGNGKLPTRYVFLTNTESKIKKLTSPQMSITFASAIEPKYKPDLNLPAMYSLSTALIGTGGRLSLSDKRLESTCETILFGENVEIKSYTVTKTGNDGEVAGRMIPSDGVILSLLQARDQEIIQKKLDQGYTDIENLFTVDVQELAKEMQDGMEYKNINKSVSQAMSRILGMTHEIGFDPNSKIAMKLSDHIGTEIDTLIFRHLEPVAFGHDYEKTKVQRFFAYKYPEMIWNDMKRDIGYTIFPRALIQRRKSTYDAIFYFWLRGNCLPRQTMEISLDGIYKSINTDENTTWKHFSSYFLEKISYHFDTNILELGVGEAIKFDFYGYDIEIRRTMKNNKGLIFKITGTRVENEARLTDEHFTPFIDTE